MRISETNIFAEEMLNCHEQQDPWSLVSYIFGDPHHSTPRCPHITSAPRLQYLQHPQTASCPSAVHPAPAIDARPPHRSLSSLCGVPDAVPPASFGWSSVILHKFVIFSVADGINYSSKAIFHLPIPICKLVWSSGICVFFQHINLAEN